MHLNINYRFILTLAPTLAFGNLLLNIIIAWLLWHNTAVVPLWGPSGIALHILTGGFIQAMVFGWVTTKLTRKALRAKQVHPLHWHLKSQTLIDRLPSRSMPRAFMLGLFGLLMTSVVLLILHWQNIQYMPLSEFISFVAILSALLVAAIVLVAIYRAMGDTIYQPLKRSGEV
ncbi:hypothetical protein [Pontibacter vulgaris]|uniref:hypothetical protein n=1 Tax=Pontibacter vulgaris TaxID=2905679 RepID=UPI001FA6BC24|nr:hypothetical protein [Pontibacter vulgaris]